MRQCRSGEDWKCERVMYIAPLFISQPQNKNHSNKPSFESFVLELSNILQCQNIAFISH